HLVDAQTNRRVVGGNNGTSADADDHLDWNLMADEAPQDAEVRRTAQTAGAQDDANRQRLLIETHRPSTARSTVARGSSRTAAGLFLNGTFMTRAEIIAHRRARAARAARRPN